MNHASVHTVHPIAACAISVAAVFALAACESPPRGRASGQVVTTGDSVRIRLETVVRGLEVPWEIAFAPDGRMFVTERPGRVRVVENGVLREQPLLTLNDVETASEAGLMGMALHPDFGSNRFVYLAYAYRTDDGIRVRVRRYRETGSELVEPTPMIENLPAARFHAGCRLSFGPDRKLYVTTGDATEPDLAQDLGSLAGKTLRLNDDGTVPSDNPFRGRPGARPEIWSYGHRNAQGIAWQPGTGQMFQTEHGPSGGDGPGGGDEVNVVEAGRNYGWPKVHHDERLAGTEPPLLEYTPAIAPAGAVFYSGGALAYNGDLFFACLRGETLVRVELDGATVRRQHRLFEDDYGRLRAVAVGPDGAIYFSTSNRDGRGSPAADDDRIIRIVPAAP